MRKTSRFVGLAIAASVAMSLFAAAPAAAAKNATLNVVHGIPGVDVNVCVNGAVAIADFNPGEVVAGVELPEGAYDVKIVALTDDCTGAAILEASGIQLMAGKNYTAIAYLMEDGSPTLGLFKNNARPVAKGTARVIVRHTAAAPEVDLWANGGILAKDVTNSDTFRAVVPKGVYAVWVSLPGDYRPVIGPEVMKFKKGHTYQVYAWGNGTGGYAFAVVDTMTGVK